MGDRPIKGNPTGKYSMVLDPTNDVAAYYGGMTELRDLVEKYFESIEYARKQIKPANTHQALYCKSKAGNQNEDTCSVCLAEFHNKERILRLLCGHYFHTQCVNEWFNTHSTCPNCRYDLAQGSTQ